MASSSFEFENADIHPEYVTTVKVAEKLTDPEFVVSLEAKMKMLRYHAAGIVRLRNCGSKSKWERGSKLIERLDGYNFGKSDGQRIDILVRTTDPVAPPVLVAEAKLGHGIWLVSSRTSTESSVYSECIGMWRSSTATGMYGAVVFHSMLDGKDMNVLSGRSSNRLNAIRAHLKELSDTHSWLRHKADLLHSFKIVDPVYGYREHCDDGSYEDVFGKDMFAFAPGLVLLGNANDIASAAF